MQLTLSPSNNTACVTTLLDTGRVTALVSDDMW